jgi:hypothetical protein
VLTPAKAPTPKLCACSPAPDIKSASQGEKLSNTSIRLGAVSSLFVFATLTQGTAMAQSTATIGGHIGVAFPIVTTGTTTTTIADQFSIAFPVGISVKGSGATFFDLELVPVVQDAPRHVSLTIHPGMLWNIGHGFTAGARLAFDVSNSVIGFTGVVIKSWPIQDHFLKSYFVEGDLPVRFGRPTGGPSTNAVGFAAHFGVGF